RVAGLGAARGGIPCRAQCRAQGARCARPRRGCLGTGGQAAVQGVGEAPSSRRQRRRSFFRRSAARDHPGLYVPKIDRPALSQATAAPNQARAPRVVICGRTALTLEPRYLLEIMRFYAHSPLPFAAWRFSAKWADDSAPHSVDRKRVSVASEITEEQ